MEKPVDQQAVPMHAYPSLDPSQQHAHVHTHSQSPPLYHDPNNPQQAYFQHPQNTSSPPPAFDHSQAQQQQYAQQQQQYAQQQQQYAQYQHQQQATAAGNPNAATHVVATSPGQPVGTERQFQHATPISNLQRGPAPVDCPACGKRGLTSTHYEIGNTTHVWAIGLCLCLLLGCIPYLISSTKDVAHKCGKCGVLLATWHRSGTTEVHIHS